MAANKNQLPLLQRRGGKRISGPSSPITERQSDEYVFHVDPPSAVEPYSATSLDSSMVDKKIPSPTFSGPDIASENSTTPRRPGDAKDLSASRYPIGDDNIRSPYFSSPASDLASRDSPRGQSYESSSRTSPLVQISRDGSEGHGWSDTKVKGQDRPNSWGRNASGLSANTYERSLFDDGSNRAPMAKKSRLNLLNPMSLLARRRSSQHGKLDDVNVSPLHVPAIPDFDPSIRGNIVHDFSTPRLRPQRRGPETETAPHRTLDQGKPRVHGPSSPALHSPMFKEHFQDEEHDSSNLGQNADSRSQTTDVPSPETLPRFARRLPTELPSHIGISHTNSANQSKTRSDTAPTPPPKATPPASLIPYDNLAPTSVPKHMKSTSSRFSFQMSGQGSTAQEQLLEERHRERFPHGENHTSNLDAEDDYDDYDFDADDGLEESIPGVNTAYQEYVDDGDFDSGDIPIQDVNLQSSYQQEERDDYDFEDEGDVGAISIKDINAPTYGPPVEAITGHQKHFQRHSLARFHFTPQSSTLSPISTGTGHGSEPTPRDSEGFPIGVADTKYSPSYARTGHPSTGEILEDVPDQAFFGGLRITTGEFASNDIEPLEDVDAFDDADLYFDDGEFEDESVKSDSQFDESLLDDANHIRDIPSENARRYESLMKQGASKPTLSHVEVEAGDGDVADGLQTAPVARSSTKASIDDTIVENGRSPSLTEDNLAAYHDALAMAANKAAANGRFDRQVSFSSSSNAAEDRPWSSSQSGLVSDASRYSGNAGNAVYSDAEPFLFDDDAEFDDDLMIAEANAEALENDEDGFYGQEFGFYARAYGKEQPEFVNGGYFTSRGFSGVKRNHSGKANFQEPSLTPITEKSEWSARNSVISLQFHSGIPNAGQSLPSPGLSQLMDSPVIDDEMTLSALIKLRRGAFGGSSTSINSMNDRNVLSSSPLAQVSGYKYPQSELLPNRMTASNPSLHNSTSILESEEEDGDDLPQREIRQTQTTPRKMAKDVDLKTPDHHISSKEAETPVTSRRTHHSRKSSGAESVSYVRDDDGRWILERRRTGDSGELEVVAREYLSSMRI